MIIPDQTIIAVDFDDTLCYSNYPKLGEPNVRLITKLKDLQKTKNYKLILWTCRNNDRLTEAVAFCEKFGLIFDAINENLPEVLEKYGNIDSRKVTADYYIDDKSLLPENISNMV